MYFDIRNFVTFLRIVIGRLLAAPNELEINISEIMFLLF